MKQVLIGGLSACLLGTHLSAHAHATVSCGTRIAWVQTACEGATNAVQEGGWDIYVFGYSYHFDRAKSERENPLNARSYGGGLGKHWTNASGNEDLVFAFAFLDSHSHIEPVAGYAHIWFSRPVLAGFALGAGIAAGITARSDILRYTPVPVIAPIASLRYRRMSVMATWFPRLGSIATSSVILTWARYEF